jgi:hypothetical protein
VSTLCLSARAYILITLSAVLSNVNLFSVASQPNVNNFACFASTLRHSSAAVLTVLLFAPLFLLGHARLTATHSLQFDPAPRRGEPHVTRRTPDYFL